MKRLSFKKDNLKSLFPARLMSFLASIVPFGKKSQDAHKSEHRALPAFPYVQPPIQLQNIKETGRKQREYRKRRKHKNAMAAVSRRINWGIC
jgi:hypothetical protein